MVHTDISKATRVTFFHSCSNQQSSKNMVLNVHRNHKAYQGRGEGGQGGMEVGGRGRLYTYCYAVATTMISTLRCAAMRAVLMFHNCE